jgi:hypothetical protein
VFDTFKAKLQSVLEAAASQDLGEDLEGEERAKVKASIANKKMSKCLAAVRVVSSTASASVEWASDYIRTAQEEVCWQETSDAQHSVASSDSDEQR